MLQLTLRSEFRGRRLGGTAIELENTKNTGATQMAAADFLELTYPSADALQSLEAVGPDRGRPLVLIGERGQGKSHLMALLHHAFTDADATRAWLEAWSERLEDQKLAALPLRDGMHVISESLHRQRYKFLWDLLFERHPHGAEVRGMWKGLGDRQTEVPSSDHLLELFRRKPTALILDEYQTWFDGLTNTKQFPWRNWAFNVVQILSEIAKAHPELLVLVVSVRNGNTDAFQQIRRVGPVEADFKSPTARRDRKKLLLHRLFENRLRIPDEQIELATQVHVAEYLRLSRTPSSEHDRVRREFVACWPFAPHLLQLLEDQVLVATQAQETRDLIRVLAQLFKRHADNSPIVTAADFRLDDDHSGVVALLDSVSNQHHANLREKALRNVSAVLEATTGPDENTPHLSEIVGALWLRSLAVGNLAGAEPETLQIDITHRKHIDDNAFQDELSTIVENSFNIHRDGPRLVFREEENPQARLIASARNDRLFEDGSDRDQLAKEVRYVIGGGDRVTQAFRVVVLRSGWESAPWEAVDDADRPERWDERLPLLVLPVSPEDVGATLGPWLRDHLHARRNAVRFLIPGTGGRDLFEDRDLLVLARAVTLAQRWGAEELAYRKLGTRYERELRAKLTKHFDRFAILDTWSYPESAHSTFHVEPQRAEGSKIPQAVEDHIRTHLFVPEEFEERVLAAADHHDSVGKLLRELQEPRPGSEPCIPWIGEIHVKERILRLCARGEIAIDLRGAEHLQVRAGEDEESAWRRMRGRLGAGKHLDETRLLRPQAVAQTSGLSGAAPAPGNATYGGESAPAVQPSGGGVQPPPGGGTPPLPISTGRQTGAHGVKETTVSTEPVQGTTLFQGSSELVPHESPATSPLNLLGKMESWGIGAGTQIREVSLQTSALTGAQLEALIRTLPDGIEYELRLKREEK